MDTFLRLAGLGTLIVGLQLVTLDVSSAAALNNDLKESICAEKSTSVVPNYNNYEPPNNGGPSSSNQGSGTR
jgi:hypothetical protein